MAGKTKHGMSRTRLYQIWADMKGRCQCETNRFYHRYGGRGITVCEEWKTFPPFMEWAVTHGYRDDLTIDRIDNDGNYTPSNCKFSTQHEQSMNKAHLPSKTGFVGVRRHGSGYAAEVVRFGQYNYVGTFPTPEAANAAREAFINERYPE